jgi:hypothetical protein
MKWRLSLASLGMALILPIFADFGSGGKGGTAFTVIMVNLLDTDDNFEFAQAPRALTLIDASCYCRGACTTPGQITFQDRATNAITLTTTPLVCGTGAGDSAYTTFDTTDVDRVLNAGEGIRLNVTNTPNPLTDEYTLQIRFR